MYIPKAFKEKDKAKILSFVKAHNFGILISQKNKNIVGTHLPFIIDETENKNFNLTTHLAALNPQLNHWKEEKDALVIFSGPHAYISPGLYASKKNVPTWNFIAVHAYGKVEIVNDFESKKNLLVHSIKTFEAEYLEQWKDLDRKYRDKLIDGMTGLKITVNDVQAKYKLSQNKPKETRDHIAEHFKLDELGKYMNE